jgi:Ca2+/Na+ antiporter
MSSVQEDFLVDLGMNHLPSITAMALLLFQTYLFATFFFVLINGSSNAKMGATTFLIYIVWTTYSLWSCGFYNM